MSDSIETDDGKFCTLQIQYAMDTICRAKFGPDWIQESPTIQIRSKSRFRGVFRPADAMRIPIKVKFCT